MKRILILTALCVAPLLGQDKPPGPDNIAHYRTCGLSNGQFWALKAEAMTNPVYLMAVMETFNVVGKSDYWPKGATIEEVQKGLDQFYQEPGNMQIPVLYALTVVKLRFESSEDKLVAAALRLARAYTAKDCADDKPAVKKQ
jgi:hypothetical protein